MKFQDFRIRTKLLLLIAMMSLIAAGIAAFGVSKITFLNQSLKTVDVVDSAATLGARMNQNTIVMNRSEYRVAADPSPETIKASRAIADQNIEQFKARLAEAAKTADADEKAQLDAVTSSYSSYLDGLNKTYDMAQQMAGQITLTQAQRKVADQVKVNRERADKLQAAVKAYVDHVNNRGTKTADEAKAQGNAAIMVMIGVAVGGVVLGVFIGMLTANFGISAPLNRSVDELRTHPWDILVGGLQRGVPQQPAVIQRGVEFQHVTGCADDIGGAVDARVVVTQSTGVADALAGIAERVVVILRECRRVGAIDIRCFQVGVCHARGLQDMRGQVGVEALTGLGFDQMDQQAVAQIAIPPLFPRF